MSDPHHPPPEWPAAFRAFVREHHPDRGGDPATFVAGMERFRTGSVDGAADHADGPAGPTPAHPLPIAARRGRAHPHLAAPASRQHRGAVTDRLLTGVSP